MFLLGLRVECQNMSVDQERRTELLVTLSVVVLVSCNNSKELLLVQDAETGKWSPPAGGLNWLPDKGRLETFKEGVERELLEEAGLRSNVRGPLAILHIPGQNKDKIGVVYESSFKGLGIEFQPKNVEEIAAVKAFSVPELIDLIDESRIRKPEFNKGLIIWWMRNRQRDMWDPFKVKGNRPLDENIVLDERYLHYWNEIQAPLQTVLFRK